MSDLDYRNHEHNPRRHPEGREYSSIFKDRDISRFSVASLLSLSEMSFLYDIPKILGQGNYANLGHGSGGSALLMACSIQENNIGGKVFSVDLFECDSKLRKAQQFVEKFNTSNFLQLCRGNTDNWANLLSDKVFKFVFVDADHSYEAVKRDFLNWSSMVKVGGWISFHDTNQEFSHRAIEDTILKDVNWRERKDYHIDWIRTFEKISI